MSSVKRACFTSVCVALCYVLPLALHGLGLGAALSPMHLPVLLCGLVCGWPYGGFCGVAGPAISCILSGMPSPAQLVYMIPELCAYGLAAGLLMGRIRTGRAWADLYLSLLPAMLLGRVVGGLCQGAFYLSTARSYSLGLWAAGYLVGTAPGAAAQVIALPLLAAALTRSGLVPERYPARGGERA